MLELVRAGGGGEHRIERIKDTPVLRLRNTLLPLLYLKEILRIGEGGGDDGFIVVTQVGSQIFGTVVDGVFHTEEIVIKPMSSRLRHIPVFSGTTILGDGSVIMILDPNGVAQSLGRAAQIAQAEANTRVEDETAPNEDIVSLLVFRAGSQRPKAVPLSLVTRLEEIDCRRIEISDGRCLVQYRDQLMPLLRVDDETGLKKEGAQPILVFSDQGRSMGLVGRRDHRHRRGQARHRSRRATVRACSAMPWSRATRPKSSTSVISCRRPSRIGFAAAIAPARARRATVLLVDDSAFFRDMLTPLIKAAGYQVMAVGSAAEALDGD